MQNSNLSLIVVAKETTAHDVKVRGGKVCRYGDRGEKHVADAHQSPTNRFRK